MIQTIEKVVEIGIDLDDIDVYEVLKKMSISDIEEYLTDRRALELKTKSPKMDGDDRQYILLACKGHIAKNIAPTKEEIKKVINDIIDMEFPV